LCSAQGLWWKSSALCPSRFTREGTLEPATLQAVLWNKRLLLASTGGLASSSVESVVGPPQALRGRAFLRGLPMASHVRTKAAGIQYIGSPGGTKDCQDGVIRLLQYGDKVSHARILTHSNIHCILLTINVGDLVAVKSGFSSGYAGTGPSGFSYILQLLHAHQAEITEYEVTEELMERLDVSALTQSDIDSIDDAKPIRPSRWPQYVSDEDSKRKQEGTQWAEFRPVIPFAIVDSRITDLALSFWDNPDQSLLTGYRRLEDILRSRTGIDDHGHGLLSKAFLGDAGVLTWRDRDKGVRTGKANLFTGAYMAYRNPRAHHEQKHNAPQYLAEFLLLNQLYTLERQSHRARAKALRRRSTQTRRKQA